MRSESGVTVSPSTNHISQNREELSGGEKGDSYGPTLPPITSLKLPSANATSPDADGHFSELLTSDLNF